MKTFLVILIALLAACEPVICEEPCQGQSGQEDRGAGIVCLCDGLGTPTSPSLDIEGVQTLLRGPEALIAKFNWTTDENACSSYRDWWAKNAPLPCKQAGGGSKRQNP